LFLSFLAGFWIFVGDWISLVIGDGHTIRFLSREWPPVREPSVHYRNGGNIKPPSTLINTSANATTRDTGADNNNNNTGCTTMNHDGFSSLPLLQGTRLDNNNKNSSKYLQ